MRGSWGNNYGHKHGDCGRGKRSNLNRRWGYIKSRCHNPKHASYHNYGGRGIVMCDLWRDSYVEFANYIRNTFDISEIPSHLEIDRIDNNKGYEPGNITLSDKRAQANNRRTNRYVEYNGEMMTISNAARLSGISKITLHYRLVNGIPDLFAPVEDTRIVYHGEKMTVSELARSTGLNRRNLAFFIKERGMSPEDAVNKEIHKND